MLENKSISTRRFLALPAAVLLVAIGFSSPKPLDSRFTPPYKREYWTPADLLRSSSLEGKKIGLVIDLTLSMEYYNGKEEFETKGVGDSCICLLLDSI